MGSQIFDLKNLTPRPNMPVVKPKYPLTQNVCPPQIFVINCKNMSQSKTQNITGPISAVNPPQLSPWGWFIKLEAAGN